MALSEIGSHSGFQPLLQRFSVHAVSMYVSCLKDLHGGGTLTSYVLAMVQMRTRTQVRYLTRMWDTRFLVWYPHSTSCLGYTEIWKSDVGNRILGYHLITSTVTAVNSLHAILSHVQCSFATSCIGCKFKVSLFGPKVQRYFRYN